VAVDDEGVPGDWVTDTVTVARRHLLPLPDGPRWVRLRALLYGRMSVEPEDPTEGAVLASPGSGSGDIDHVIDDLIEDITTDIGVIDGVIDDITNVTIP